MDDIDSLVRVYRSRLLRYVAFSTGDSDLAESITQDCLLKAFKTRQSFREECSVRTWLFGIANNLIRDRVRTKKFKFWSRVEATSIDLTDPAMTQVSEERSPESHLLTMERIRQVHRVVRELSMNQRRVFILKFLEEMDLNEIASVAGMPENTVKTHLHRAVKAVRSRLGGMQ